MEDITIYGITWQVIHLVGRSYTPEKAQSFYVFFEGLRDLFPLKLVRDTINEFMRDEPLYYLAAKNQIEVSDHLLNSARAFAWTYSLHNRATYNRTQSCNAKPVIAPTMTQVYGQYDVQYYPKEKWGGLFWILLHYIIANLPKRLTRQQHFQIVTFIEAYKGILPCPDCRKHMTEYLTKHPILDYNLYNTQNNLWIWSFAFHNAVNDQLGHPILPPAMMSKVADLYTSNSSDRDGVVLCQLPR